VRRGAVLAMLYAIDVVSLLASNDARFFQFTMTIALPMALVLIFLPRTKENEAWN